MKIQSQRRDLIPPCMQKNTTTKQLVLIVMLERRDTPNRMRMRFTIFTAITNVVNYWVPQGLEMKSDLMCSTSDWSALDQSFITFLKDTDWFYMSFAILEFTRRLVRYSCREDELTNPEINTLNVSLHLTCVSKATLHQSEILLHN